MVDSLRSSEGHRHQVSGRGLSWTWLSRDDLSPESLMPVAYFSQAIEDSRRRIYGLLGDLQGLEYEAPSRLRFAFAVEAGYGLALLERVSWLYEDFDAGAWVDSVALLLAAGTEGEGCAADARRPETGYETATRGLYFPYLGRDREVFEGVCVAALGLDERSELLVGSTRGERIFDGSGRFRDAFLRQEMGGDVVDFADEVVGDGLVLE